MTPNEIKDYLGDLKGLRCLECGKYFKALGTHLLLAHGTSKEEYCAAYGIPSTRPLVCKHTRELMSESAVARIDDRFLELSVDAIALGHVASKGKRKQQTEVTCPDCAVKHFKDEITANARAHVVRCARCHQKARREIALRSYYAAPGVATTLCSQCQTAFVAKGKNKKNVDAGKPAYCSRRCVAIGTMRPAGQRGEKNYDRKCPECRKQFITKRKFRTYCGRNCYSAVMARNPRLREIATLGGRARAARATRADDGCFTPQAS